LIVGDVVDLERAEMTLRSISIGNERFWLASGAGANPRKLIRPPLSTQNEFFLDYDSKRC
jgi:hypothetical protein